MGVNSDRARVAELSFQVYNRALHPDWFSTRVHRRVSQPNWEADVRIIAGGHVVNFGSGPIRVTEILSGPQTDLPEAGVIFQSDVRVERSVRLQPGGLIDYQSCFEAERVDAEIFRHLYEELVADSQRCGLVHQFKSLNRLLPPALSQVQVEPRLRGLSVLSFHTFPEECAIVRSQSLYELSSELSSQHSRSA